jgi:hypothetical protein
MGTMAKVGCAILLVSALQSISHATDVLFSANLETSPDCSSFGAPGCPGFAVEVPPVQIEAGQDITYCYSFFLPNSAETNVGRFSATFDPMIRDVIVYAEVDGLVATYSKPWPRSFGACGDLYGPNEGGGGGIPVRIYQAHESPDQLRMPSDDGSGHPVALTFPASVTAVTATVQMRFVNPGPVVKLAMPLRFAVNSWEAGASFTHTATYAALGFSLQVAPNSTGNFSRSCSVPPGAKFWWFSTHTHEHSTNTTVSDGSKVIVSSNDWLDPAVATFSAPDFYEFSGSNPLTYSCSFSNDLGTPLNYGPSYSSMEHCDAVAYYFPATSFGLCFDDALN